MNMRLLLPVNSALARPLVPLFIQIGFSANAITLLSILFGFLGVVGLLQGTVPGIMAGALGFLVANILDECDGKVARQTGTSSRLGALLDTWADFLVHTAFFLALGIGMSRQFSVRSWLVLGIIAAIGNVVSFILDLRGFSGVQTKDQLANQAPDCFAWMTEWFRVDFSILVLVSALLHQTGWILWAGAVGVFLVWIPSTVLIVARRR